MFIDPSITVAALSALLKDWAIVGTLAYIVWRLRGFFDTAVLFVARVNKHMNLMEGFASKTLNNHLAHIQHDLRTLSGRKSDIIEIHESFSDTPSTEVAQKD